MPYVNADVNRAKYEEALQKLMSLVKESDIEDREGDLNYLCTRLVANCMRPETGWRYKYLARGKAVFTEARDEFNRRLVSYYEDSCISKNGDIPEYEHYDKEREWDKA